MKKKSYRRRRDQSDQFSSSSFSQDSPKRPQDLYGQLKSALHHNDRYIYKTVRSITKHYKHQVGILRITISGSFTFSQADIQDFFRRYGKIQNVILKQGQKVVNQQAKAKQQQSIAYVIYSDYFAAILALKILNSVSQKQRIIRAKICSTNPNENDIKLFSEPSLSDHKYQQMIVEIEKDHQFGDITQDYKYVGTIGLDLNDSKFKLRQRILGVQGSNFVRIYYLCDKSFKFQNEGQQSNFNDMKLKLIINKNQGSDRDVLVMSHSLQKYNQAIRFLHQLMEQIIEEYKNSREKSQQIIAKDIHVRRWEKFSIEPQLKFLT